MAKTKKETTVTKKSEKPLTDLKTFIENINKKDKMDGKQVHFDFVKRKRKN